MSIRVEWKGLSELLIELRGIPEEIQSDASEVIRNETEGAAQEIRMDLRARFKPHTGNLVAGVRTFYPHAGRGVVLGLVRNVSPHSHLMEFGTKKRMGRGDRRWKHATQANRGRVQKANPTITPTIARQRRARIARQLIQLLRGMGFIIGEAA